MTFTITKNYFDFLHKKSKENEDNDPNNLESVIIKQILDNCTIINDADESRKIHLGDTINILYLDTNEKKSYKIVHSDRANPEKNEISNLSPMGSTILNSSLGGNCVVKLPIKKIKIKIISKNNENEHDSSFNKYEEILTICSFFKSFKVDNQELKIEPLLYSVYLYYYHPRRGGSNPKFDDVSNSILRFKENNLEVIKSFFYKLDHILKDNIILCCVPSHDSKKTSGSLYNLIGKLTEKNTRIDVSSCLVRIRSVEKLSTGGNRDLKTHLNSIEVKNRDLIRNKKVLIIDDVMTSGNSLIACKKLLLEAGASRVGYFTLSRTI